MENFKHTPGPWKAVKAKNRVWYEVHYGDDGECVAEVVYSESDARLIAAAPLLLREANILAVLSIQSDRYRDEADFKEAVDNMLTAISIATNQKEVENESI